MTDTRKPRPGGEVVVYEGPDGEVALDVRLEQETVWLTREQMAAVFTSTTENIRQHLRNIFVDSELEESATTKDFLVVRSEGDRRVQRRIRHYNLDAIISVGYRTLRNQALVEDTGRAVLELVTRYADTWRLLLEYDEDRLEAPAGTRPPSAALDHGQAVAAIADFRAALIARGEASPLFGNPRGEALEGILGNVEQTMFGEPLYRTREEKAANLLYFLVKDHPFTDGSSSPRALPPTRTCWSV